MSAGGYEGPHMPPSFPRFDHRRNHSSTYDRPIPIARPGSPSPGPSRRGYDSYVPPRPTPSYRDGASSNSYRENNYRPTYSGSYYSRSPSPDQYGSRPRSSDPDLWDRPAWQAAPPVTTSNNWSDRKQIPPSPSSVSSRGRGGGGDTVASRMFEPSNSWKQTQVERPLRVDTSPASDRYVDRRVRSTYDKSPEGIVRNDRALNFSADRYRPPPPKSTGRSDYDSYRPRYDDGWSASPRREPISPAGSHRSRRDSGSFSHARASDRYDSPYSSQHLSSRKGSFSSPRGISPSRSANSEARHVSDHDSLAWSYPPSLDTAKREHSPPRPPSRSSIASTRVSSSKPPSPTGTPAPPSSPMNITPAQDNFVVKTDLTSTKTDSPKPPTVNAVNGATTTRESSQPPPMAISGPSSPITARPVSPIPTTADVSIQKYNEGVDSQQPQMNLEAPPSLPLRDQDEQGDVTNGKIDQLEEKIDLVPAPVPAMEVNQSAPNSVPPPKRTQPVVAPSPKSPVQPNRELSPALTPAAESRTDSDKPTATQLILPQLDAPTVPSVSCSLPRQVPTLEEIPSLSEVTSKEDALRVVVMTRLRHDLQTRAARVEPILMTNFPKAPIPPWDETPTPQVLIDEICEGQQFRMRMETFATTRILLKRNLEQRQCVVDDKIAQLREEYLTIQENWFTHCQSLNDQQKTLATEQEMQHTGRTTRRTTAITDAVRSDFEMEQIIASLGNDDATDPNHLSVRNLAKVPDMISVVNGKVDHVFDDTSHRVEDPAEYYAPHTGIEDWTPAEKQLFEDKYAQYPKQFGVIANFLPNKTAGQCVDYYYLHKKVAVDFRKVISQFGPNKRRRRGMGKKKGNGLLADIALHDAEVSRGLSSASPSSAPRPPRGRKTMTAAGEARKVASAARRNAVQFEDTPTSTPTPEPDSRPRRRRIISTTTAQSISTPMPPASSTKASVLAISTPRAEPVPIPTPALTVPIPVAAPTAYPVSEGAPPEQETEPRPAKRMKRTRKIKSLAIVQDEPGSPGAETKPFVTPNPHEALNRGRIWSEEDRQMFTRLLAQYGDDFKRIAASMPNKTTVQVTNFYRDNQEFKRVAARAPRKSPSPGYTEVSFAKTVTGPSMASAGSPTRLHPAFMVNPSPLPYITSYPPPGPSGTRDPNRRPSDGIQPPPWSGGKILPHRYPLPVPHPSMHSRRESYPYPNDGSRAGTSVGLGQPPDGIHPHHIMSETQSRHYPSASYTSPPLPSSVNGRNPPPTSSPYGRLVPVVPPSPSTSQPRFAYAYPQSHPHYPPPPTNSSYDIRTDIRTEPTYLPARSYMPDDAPRKPPAPATVKKENPYPVFDGGTVNDEKAVPADGGTSATAMAAEATANNGDASDDPYTYPPSVWSP